MWAAWSQRPAHRPTGDYHLKLADARSSNRKRWLINIGLSVFKQSIVQRIDALESSWCSGRNSFS